MVSFYSCIQYYEFIYIIYYIHILLFFDVRTQAQIFDATLNLNKEYLFLKNTNIIILLNYS